MSMSNIYGHTCIFGLRYRDASVGYNSMPNSLSNFKNEWLYHIKCYFKREKFVIGHTFYMVPICN